MLELMDQAFSVIERAKRAGADEADIALVRSHSRNVGVRLGKVETMESSEEDHVSLRVFVGKRVASISVSQLTEPEALVQRAMAMAKVSPENPFEGQPSPDLLVKQQQDLDLFDRVSPTIEALIEDAQQIEAAALNVPGVNNSSGADVFHAVNHYALLTSGGFSGQFKSSSFARSCSVLAGDGIHMERDYDYSSALHQEDLVSCQLIGENAGKGACARLGGRQANTGPVNVIFSPRVARTIAGHIAAMVNGLSVARKTSLLCDYMEKSIMKSDIQVTDNPLQWRGLASRPFDAEAIEGKALTLIKDGVLQEWLLSSSVGRELGRPTNGRGVRRASSIIPAASNFAIEAGQVSVQDMISSLSSGFYVTELVGHGVDLVTGQYSRGASGFWIDQGSVSWPVHEVTLASDLLHMLSHLSAANDLDRHYAIAAPTLLIEGMILAGK